MDVNYNIKNDLEHLKFIMNELSYKNYANKFKNINKQFNFYLKQVKNNIELTDLQREDIGEMYNFLEEIYSVIGRIQSSALCISEKIESLW